MVCLLTDSLEQYLRPCFARPKLYEAHNALKRGDLIAAGCLLREAARRFLFAQCEYHRCLPSKRRQKSPGSLLHALDKAGHCKGCCFEWMQDIIDCGNKLAHCHAVKESLVSCCIDLLHNLLDYSTGHVELRREGGSHE
jgi:hypothetical protein